jgi:hypothetical protein
MTKPAYKISFERNMAAGLNNGRTAHFMASTMSPQEYRAAIRAKRIAALRALAKSIRNK